jgi:hypothetical protein
MKNIIIGTIILTTLIVFGCGRQKPGTEIQGGKEEVSSKDREIVRAIEHAYGLEKTLWKREKSIKSKDDVVHIFREGFCKEKAQELADYYWLEEQDQKGNMITMLRAADPVLVLPDSIEVLQRKKDTALALLHYKANTEGPVVWGEYTLKESLMLEDGVWKICSAE